MWLFNGDIKFGKLFIICPIRNFLLSMRAGMNGFFSFFPSRLVRQGKFTNFYNYSMLKNEGLWSKALIWSISYCSLNNIRSEILRKCPNIKKFTLGMVEP
jgi:hypothetical protein